jgi:hypothetical protein
MGKLMRVTRGTAFLVAVDIRKRITNAGEVVWYRDLGGEPQADLGACRVWARVLYALGLRRDSVQMHRYL